MEKLLSVRHYKLHFYRPSLKIHRVSCSIEVVAAVKLFQTVRTKKKIARYVRVHKYRWWWMTCHNISLRYSQITLQSYPTFLSPFSSVPLRLLFFLLNVLFFYPFSVPDMLLYKSRIDNFVKKKYKNNIKSISLQRVFDSLRF
jgi:hypothetical protein